MRLELYKELVSELEENLYVYLNRFRGEIINDSLIHCIESEVTSYFKHLQNQGRLYCYNATPLVWTIKLNRDDEMELEVSIEDLSLNYNINIFYSLIRPIERMNIDFKISNTSWENDTKY